MTGSSLVVSNTTFVGNTVSNGATFNGGIGGGGGGAIYIGNRAEASADGDIVGQVVVSGSSFEANGVANAGNGTA